MKVNNPIETVQQITLEEDQQELQYHKDEECCLKESIGKITDLIEEVRMELATDDKCTQDMGHTFMTPLGISDQDYSQEIETKLPKNARSTFSSFKKIAHLWTFPINPELQSRLETFLKGEEERTQAVWKYSIL